MNSRQLYTILPYYVNFFLSKNISVIFKWISGSGPNNIASRIISQQTRVMYIKICKVFVHLQIMHFCLKRSEKTGAIFFVYAFNSFDYDPV
jgi:hypothetical protein